MNKEYYVASCVFTSQYPQTSRKIQQYIKDRFGMPIVRCCVPKYKRKEFTEKMPADYQEEWSSLPDSGDFQPGDTVYSLCHNCSNIIEETKPGVRVVSLWELILSDESFQYPDYGNVKATVQDCWRAQERLSEQKAVRSLLEKMNIDVVELQDNYDKTDFCGVSLYRPQPERNPKMAPLHYVEKAEGKFLPHTPEEQKSLMEEYCRQFRTDRAVCYCHYCLEGLLLGGMNAKHIADLLFPRSGRQGNLALSFT